MSKYPEFETHVLARRYCAEKGLIGKVHIENPSIGRVVIIDKPSEKPAPTKKKKDTADE